MPKFIATSGSYFEPFSYEQLVAPVAHMQQAHNAAQDAYDQISLETNALERYLSENPDEDVRAKELYNNYRQKLQTLQDNLWNNGVSAQTRRDLAAARAGYASDMNRLANAIQTRQTRSQEYWKALHNNPNLIAGKDPGTASLDEYLANDQYGQNWWSYDTAQFEKDMAAETKARAQELLRGLTDPNGVVRNPKLAGQLTRVIHNGFTNGEIQTAGQVVDDVINMNQNQRAQYYTDNNIDPVVQLLSESLINRYDATGIRGEEVTDEDRMRLINRGKSGWTAGVLAPDVKDFNDPYFVQNMEYAKRRYKYNLEHPAGADDGTGRLQDTNTTIVSGQNAGAARNRLNEAFGTDNATRVTSNGTTVRGGAQASDLVFSGDLRRRAFAELGFDIGRNPDRFASKNFLTGEITHNGVVYETQYNPKANGGDGAVKFRVKGSGVDWNSAQPSPALTEKYNEYRRQYLDTIQQYRNNDNDVYRMATLDPDHQYDLYKDYNVPFTVPLTSASDYIMAQPQNQDKVTVKRTYVARGGTDSGQYIGRLSGLISESIPVDSDGNTSRHKDWSSYDGQPGHIHAITRYGTLDNKSIQNPGDVFHFNKNTGEIDNIASVQIDTDALLNGYLILGTTSSDQLYGVGLDMVKSDYIRGLYEQARQKLYNVLVNPSLSDVDKDRRVDAILSQTSVQLKNILGYYTNTQSQGGTSQKNTN